MVIKAWGPLFGLFMLAGTAIVGLFVEHPEPHNRRQSTITPFRNNRPEIATAHNQNQHDEKGEQESNWINWIKGLFYKPSDTLLVVFNGLLVLFTGLLYRATAGLFRETAGLRSAADQQSREASIEAAQKSADAARDSANTYIKTERPYVLISEIQPIPLLGIVSSQGSQGKIKNFGRTPAIMRQISSQLRLSKDKSGITLYTVLQGVIVLGGSEDHLFEIPLEEVLNEQRVGMIQTGESQYWLHFSFVYEDISGATHETAGRWKYNYTARTWSGDYEKIT